MLAEKNYTVCNNTWKVTIGAYSNNLYIKVLKIKGLNKSILFWSEHDVKRGLTPIIEGAH